MDSNIRNASQVVGAGVVLQVSISQGGIPKRAIPAGDVGPLGILGDVQRNLKSHGGPRQALLWIASEALIELQEQGFAVLPGSMGENITTRGIDRRTVRVGQHWRIGAIEIEITKLRAPCDQLSPLGEGIQHAVYDKAVKAGDPASAKWGLAGFYAAVTRPGPISPGDPVTLLADRA